MKTNYLRNTWNLQEARTTLRQQMADHARGERLRQLRNARGMSQEDVARALGVTTKTYGTWEKGGGIRAHNARTIARYFKVKPAELITPEFEAEPPITTLSEEDVERLKRIEEKMDEILRRTAPSEPARPESEPVEGDEIPTDLPDGQDSEPASPSEGEDESAAAS